MPKTLNVGFFRQREVAELLGVDVRTVERWILDPAKREVFGPVRSRTRWRIPRPKSPEMWVNKVRPLLNVLGAHLKEPWELELETLDHEGDAYLPVIDRLYMAALFQSQARACPNPISPETKAGILDLRATVERRLASFVERSRGGKMPNVAEMEKHLDGFKAILPDRLVSYWPDKRLLQCVRRKRRPSSLERLFRQLDATQAIGQANQSGRPPTAQNVRQMLHSNLTHQVNDTGEEFPPELTVKAPTGKELRLAAQRDHLAQRPIPPSIPQSSGAQLQTVTQAEPFPRQSHVVDLREPQEGISLRGFRRFYPKKHASLRDIVNAIYDVQESNPAIDKKPHTGKTPIRGPDYGAPLDEEEG